MAANGSMEGGQVELAGFAPDAGLTLDDVPAMSLGMMDAPQLEESAQALSEPPQGGPVVIGEGNAMIMDLPVIMKVVLGSAKLPLASVAKLAKGSVVKLDKKVGEPVDILVNGRLIARGELVVLDEEESRFGVVLTHVGPPPPNGR